MRSNCKSADCCGHFDFENDAIFDLAWSEIDPDVVIVGGGDGRVYQMNVNEMTRNKTMNKTKTIQAHKKEISSLDWCPLRQDKFLSTSWDSTIRSSTGTIFRGHAGVVNEARWSPRHGNLFMSVSGDKTGRLWDDRSSRASAVISGDYEFFSTDWNKYDEWSVVTATTPADLLFWDLRSISRGPVNLIPGAHRRAIKRVRFSPWQGDRLVSVGFDMALRSWDLSALNPRGPHFDQFTEFATGIEWSIFEKNKIFSCSWDETIRVHFVK